jgi:hypothetical protein
LWYGPSTRRSKGINPASFNREANEKEFKGKKVVLFAVPGAFTPGCQVKHLPPYVERYGDFKKKGVDIIAVISANDAYVPFPSKCLFPLFALGELRQHFRFCRHGPKRMEREINSSG